MIRSYRCNLFLQPNCIAIHLLLQCSILTLGEKPMVRWTCPLAEREFIERFLAILSRCANFSTERKLEGV